MAASGLLLGFGVLAGVMYGFWAFPIVLSVLAMIEMIQRRLTWRIVLVGIVGVGLGATRTTLAPDPVAIGNLAESRAAEGVVASMPVTSGGSERVIVRIDRMQDAGEMWHDGDGRVLAYMPSSGPDVNMGDRVFVVWEATPLSELAPGYASYLSSLNVSGSARVWYARIDQRG
ncbi:MAG TPA: DUF4131 domain-containing protein, partial [Thermomicrobiales bacterium]|nr:DUF4131 domain-containing protein [Thermomicrobiales bacterium]